jgi:signal transduction histidine kinase
MSSLADLIDGRTEEIVNRFADRIYASAAAVSLPREEIIDSLREFLAELSAALRAGARRAREAGATSLPAQQHGLQRFHLGYEVTALIREYGTIPELLFELVDEHRIEVTVPELRALSQFVIGSISAAAASYANRRDEEVRGHAAEHLAFLAHELRNPLSSARMALGLIRDRGELTPSRAADSLERGLQRLTTLIDDALVNVRLKAAASIHCEQLDIAALISELVAESSAEIEAKNLSVTAHGEGECLADRRALRSALSNLLRNAVKFTPAGKKIAVRVKHGEGRIVIEVEDACGGLADDKVHKLFDPYVQAGYDRSGFGLGLAIAKHAAEAHSGEIRVHNLPDVGCVFVIDLPDHPQPCGRPGPANDEPSAGT